MKTFIFLLAVFVLSSVTLKAQIATTTTLTSTPNPSCLNEPVTLTATVDQLTATGDVHFWEGPILLGNGTLGIGGTATLTLSNLSAGNHTITVVYDGAPPFNGGLSAAIIHTVNSPPSIINQPLPQTVGAGCNTSFSVTANGTEPITYQWRKDGADIAGANSSTLTINNVAAADGGNYDVVVSNSCGTATSNAATLTVNSPLAVTLTSQTNALCFGAATGAVNITAAGGVSPYTYAWTGTGVNATAEDQTGLAAGTYTVTVTDNNNCTATTSVTITQPAAALALSEAHVNVLCFGNATGSVDLTVNGGTTPYTYVWSNGAATQDITTLAAGTYTVTVTDNNNCTATTSVTITQPAAALALSEAHVNVLCFGNATGSVDLTVNGGTAPYTYLWSNGAATQDITALVAGTYSVTVT
ncbi:Ig-like domain repeat protein, partial [Terrimonas pollutisoli]|uniref:Ig-like domain repeat protein n=1 Tax=Terrimonas pollutisoli TaxID=3034147 RepID=UPI0023EB1D50